MAILIKIEHWFNRSQAWIVQIFRMFEILFSSPNRTHNWSNICSFAICLNWCAVYQRGLVITHHELRKSSSLAIGLRTHQPQCAMCTQENKSFAWTMRRASDYKTGDCNAILAEFWCVNTCVCGGCIGRILEYRGYSSNMTLLSSFSFSWEWTKKMAKFALLEFAYGSYEFVCWQNIFVFIITYTRGGTVECWTGTHRAGPEHTRAHHLDISAILTHAHQFTLSNLRSSVAK